MISKDISTSKSNNSDLDEVGKDDSANNISHLIGMHQLF